MEWPESRQLAALYQSPGPAGIGFAQYASSGTVTPALWANINLIEAQGMYSEPGREEWSADMMRLRQLLKAEGIEPPNEGETEETTVDAVSELLISKLPWLGAYSASGNPNANLDIREIALVLIDAGYIVTKEEEDGD